MRKDPRTFWGLFWPLGSASGKVSEQKWPPKPGRYSSLSQSTTGEPLAVTVLVCAIAISCLVANKCENDASTKRLRRHVVAHSG